MIGIMVWLVVALPLLLTAVFVIELVAGIALPKAAAVAAAAPLPATVVIVPAHDEAAGLAATLDALHAAVEGLATVLVVADNCSDDTAAIGRAAGATVIERDDPANRGKGFALDHAHRHLAAAPPAIVVVLDADCRIDRASIRAMVAQAGASDRAVQATNLLEPDLTAAVPVQFSNFAFLVRNRYRQIGLFRLSGGVNLTGTGMAFPWRVFTAARLASADLVEDLALGLDLAAAGEAAQPAPRATVWSRAGSADATLTQRQRWEGGYMTTVRREGAATARRALRRPWARGAVWRTLNLLVPPFTLLLAADLCLFAAAWLVSGLGGATIAMAVAIVAVVLALGIVWVRDGRRYLSGAAIVRLPLFVLWKLSLYRRLVRGMPSHWVRTARS